MFNTISGIENDEGVFFDKQNDIKYKRHFLIFDLALGIETVENILKSERKAELENHLAKLIRKNKTISSKPQTIKSVLKFCKSQGT
jgi:hypothetical protein